MEIKLVDYMGKDLTVVNAARVSFASRSQSLDKKDEKLIQYLADHEHMSPFEHCVATFFIKCPLYIRSQIMRHRTFSYNEVSRRYTSKDLQAHYPRLFREQHKSNRQASGDTLPILVQGQATEIYRDTVNGCIEAYNNLITLGVCREQARALLPQGLYTEFYMTGNLRNWAHFIKLRIHEGAQLEVQTLAKEIDLRLCGLWPIAMKALDKSGINPDNVNSDDNSKRKDPK